MPVTIHIDATSEKGRRQLEALRMSSSAVRAELNRAIADQAKEATREHFRGLALDRNSPGGSGGRRAFYGIARDSTISRADDKEAVVEVTGPRGLRQRVKGGTIRPGPGKSFLAIPVDPIVKGVRAAEAYDDLDLRPIIAANKATGIMYSRLHHPTVKKGERVRVLYALTREVTQAADPTVLPAEREIQTAARQGARLYLRHKFGTGGEGGVT